MLQVCVHLDGSNAENKISLLVILCIIKKKKNLNRYFCFNITDYGKNISQPIYRSISTEEPTRMRRPRETSERHSLYHASGADRERRAE